MLNILKKFRAVFWVILAFAGGAIATTVIGNWGMAILIWLWDYISTSLKADYWPWGITFVSICITILIWWMNRYLNVAFQTSTNLLEMDDSLLRLLGTWDRSLPYDTELRRMLNEILRDTIREFQDDVQRGFVLLPSLEASENLTIWTHFRMLEESLDMTFYIGDDEQRRLSEAGVAGMVFLQKKLRVVHMERTNKGWTSDDKDFKVFSRMNLAPVYRSFVCIPIIGPFDPTTGQVVCLGVLVLDSRSRSFFDVESTQLILRSFARRISLAIIACQGISHRQTKKEDNMPNPPQAGE